MVAQTEGASREKTLSLLTALSDYTRYHFREEAQLMRMWDIDDAQRTTHLKAHERFIAFLGQVGKLAVSHPAEFTVDLLTFLAQWLLHHIMGLDASMARAIRAKQGVVPTSAAEPNDNAAQQYLVDLMGQLTDNLGQRTFDLLEQRDQLLAQRQELLGLQNLYRALLHSAEALIHSPSEAEMLKRLCETLTLNTDFHTVWIGRPGSSMVFDILALAGSGEQLVRETPPRLDTSPETSIIVRAWNSQRVVVCNEPQGDAGLRPWHAKFASHGWASLLAAPVMRGPCPWAVMVFVSGRSGAFEEGTVILCTRIADLLSHGLNEFDRKEQLVHLEQQEALAARTDALTKLPNRFAMELYLPQAMERARRHGTALAVGMIDLDDFKPVNDRFGHAAGDVLLQEIAHRLQAQLRGSDYLARLGGDEFVLVFEDLDTANAEAQLAVMLKRLQHVIQEPFDLGQERNARVGMTLGLAIFPGNGEDSDTLLRNADAAMYQAKARKNHRFQWWNLWREETTASGATPK